MPRAPDAAPSTLSEAEASRWRDLAVLLVTLLAASAQSRRVEAEHHAAELASERDAHRRALLRDREDFLDVVAHELKTPVAIIRAYAELLEEQLADQPVSPNVREVVGTIREQADLMTVLIEEVLDVQRLRLGKLPLEISRIDIAQLARGVAAEIQRTTGHHTIRVTAPEQLPPLLADRRRLRQVLNNLLENAVKFSAGGEIEVEVRLLDDGGAPSQDGAAPQAAPGMEAAGRRRCIEILVRDQGVGLEQADLGRIFERFGQVSGTPVRGHIGLGLGLYIARQIVRAHGGEIWAESPGRGRGSTFHVRLPLEASPAV